MPKFINAMYILTIKAIFRYKSVERQLILKWDTYCKVDIEYFDSIIPGSILSSFILGLFLTLVHYYGGHLVSDPFFEGCPCQILANFFFPQYSGAD